MKNTFFKSQKSSLSPSPYEAFDGKHTPLLSKSPQLLKSVAENGDSMNIVEPCQVTYKLIFHSFDALKFS